MDKGFLVPILIIIAILGIGSTVVLRKDTLNLRPVPTISPTPTQTLQACPSEWIVNKQPCAYEKSPDECQNRNNEYYILDGQRREIEEFDAQWVKNNCFLKPTIVQ